MERGRGALALVYTLNALNEIFLLVTHVARVISRLVTRKPVTTRERGKRRKVHTGSHTHEYYTYACNLHYTYMSLRFLAFGFGIHVLNK